MHQSLDKAPAPRHHYRRGRFHRLADQRPSHQGKDASHNINAECVSATGNGAGPTGMQGRGLRSCR